MPFAQDAAPLEPGSWPYRGCGELSRARSDRRQAGPPGEKLQPGLPSGRGDRSIGP